MSTMTTEIIDKKEHWAISADSTDIIINTENKYLNKNILLKAMDYIKTVTSIPSEKDTSVIYNSTDGKYYLWKEE